MYAAMLIRYVLAYVLLLVVCSIGLYFNYIVYQVTTTETRLIITSTESRLIINNIKVDKPGNIFHVQRNKSANILRTYNRITSIIASVRQDIGIHEMENGYKKIRIPNKEKILSYIMEIEAFEKERGRPIGHICEVGYNYGHHAALFLDATRNSSYTGLNTCHDTAEAKLTLNSLITYQYNSRSVRFISSPKSSLVNSDLIGQCDVIHLDGLCYGNFPTTDLVHMERFASKNSNLLLIDNCNSSWPVLMHSVKKASESKTVTFRSPMLITPMAGSIDWCVGRYNAKTTSGISKQNSII